MAASSSMVDKVLVVVALAAIGVAIYVMVAPSGKPPANGNGKAGGPAEQPAAPVDVPADATAAEGEALSAIATRAREILAKPEARAERVQVQHILVAFSGAERASVQRTKGQAAARALDLMKRIEGGEDFTALMKDNSDDPGPGIYEMAMGEVDPASGVYPRGQMALAFGDVGWRLKVGEVGVSDYSRDKSPFGYHIIKRLK